MVGTLGSVAMRLALVTPSTLSLPACTLGMIATLLLNMTCTVPESRSIIAADRPLYGTCVISMPAMLSKITAASYEELPLPLDAKLSLPGFFFA